MPPPRLVVPLALVLVALLAAACGGSPSASVASLGSTTTTSPATSTGSPPGSPGTNSGSGGGNNSGSSLTMGGVSVKFATCMRSHGVPNFPDPQAGGQVQISGIDPNSSAFQNAQNACEKYSNDRGKAPTPAMVARAQAQALKFSECMRSHGITNFPDPQFTSSGGKQGISIRIKGGSSSDLNPNNPLFQKAQKACMSDTPGKLGVPASGAASVAAG